MKILSLNITEFGKLLNKEISFSDGFNLIEGDNESGKSTLLLFVTYMLYGLQKTSRKGAPDAFDKQRAMNWDTKRAQGSMTVLIGDRRLKIERENQKRSASSVAKVIDVDTGEELSFTAEVGEELLGIGRDTFESCLWCGQLRSGNISGESLSATLSNLSLTADESINGDDAVNALRAARKQYKHERGSGGRISELDSAIAELKKKRAVLEEKLKNSYSDRERIGDLEAERIKVSERLTAVKSFRDAQKILSVLDGFKRLDADEAKLRQAEEELAALKAENGYTNTEPNTDILAKFRILLSQRKDKEAEYKALMSANPAEPKVDIKSMKTAEEILKTSDEKTLIGQIGEKEKKIKTKKLLSVTLFVLTALSAASALLFLPLIALSPIPLILAVILLSLSAKEKRLLTAQLRDLGADPLNYRERIAYCFSQRQKYIDEKRASLNLLEQKRLMAENDLEKIQSEISRIRGDFGTPQESEEELTLRIERYLRKREDANRRIMLVSSFVQRDRQQLDRYDRSAVEAALPKNIPYRSDLTRENADSEFAAATSALEDIDRELTDLKIRLSGSNASPEELVDLSGQLEALNKERREAVYRYDTLTKAIEATEAAYSNMRRNFAPKIRSSASENLSAISGGKYKELFLSDSFSLGIDVNGSEKELGLFSAGAKDGAYLALRLALVENIFSEGMPLFLDETVSNLDDSRAISALNLLHSYVKRGGQCILLTCHKREAELCEKAGIGFTKINIE